MPAIPPELLDTVVYLYPDVKSADEGARFGGSGFVVFWPIQMEPFPVGFVYIITNSHVILEGKSTIVRTNRLTGGMEIIKDTEKGWIHHPDGDDLAILPVALKYEESKAKGLNVEWLLTKEKLKEFMLGPGDEAFLIGRFVNHEGKQKNTPTARFGHIAMLPDEPVRTSRGLLQEAFLVECNSLPGYSGSPVFVHPYPFSYFARKVVPPMLLGVDMGHLLDDTTVLDRYDFEINGKKTPIDKNWLIETNTGMSCVIPAWKVLELLNVEELVQKRKEGEEHFRKERASSRVSADVKMPEKTVFTQSDFEAALRRVSGKNSSKT